MHLAERETAGRFCTSETDGHWISLWFPRLPSTSQIARNPVTGRETRQGVTGGASHSPGTWQFEPHWRNHRKRQEKEKKDIIVFKELEGTNKTLTIFQIHMTDASVHSPPYLKRGEVRTLLSNRQGCSQFQENMVPHTWVSKYPKGGGNQWLWSKNLGQNKKKIS